MLLDQLERETLAEMSGYDIKRDASRSMLQSADLVLIDLDGCLAFEGRPHPAAAALLRSLEGRYAIVSNNSTHSAEEVAGLLGKQGLTVDPERVFLAGVLMIDLLAKQIDRNIFLLASPSIMAYARRKGLRLVEGDTASIVALARDTTLTYDKIRIAVSLLSAGADLIVSNPDFTHPGHGHVPIPETGALLALLQSCVPDAIPQIVGKPSQQIFEAALQRFGARTSNSIMIGDNPDTDEAGAKAAGLRWLLVGPGRAHASISDLVA